MIKRDLVIGRWHVEFYFAEEEYDSEELLDRLYYFGASAKLMRRVLELMEEGEDNTGFTFTNPEDYVAVVAIGPTSSGGEFVNTFVHELMHLATAIASELGVDLTGESPAYLAGDSAREFVDIVCRLGCRECRGES